MRLNESTLAKSVTCHGTGLHSGVPATLTLHPAPAGHGIVFRRADVTDADPLVPALYDHVASTMLGTTLRNAAGTEVLTVEHLMAALSAAGIDNALIDIDGRETPIMDGSSAPFVALVEEAGIHEQPMARYYVRVLREVEVREGDRIARLEPHEGFEIDCDIEFTAKAIGRQRLVLKEGGFKDEVARARTFTELKDIELMHAHGLAKGGSLDNAVVFHDDAILNPEGLRFADECVRHKTLDVVGDLALAGRPILGRFVGVKMGHTMNNRLLRALFADPDSYELVPAGGGGGSTGSGPPAAAAA